MSDQGQVKPRFAVMRQDDNGNLFEVKRFFRKSEAEARVREFESHGHKQHYWVMKV